MEYNCFKAPRKSETEIWVRFEKTLCKTCKFKNFDENLKFDIFFRFHFHSLESIKLKKIECFHSDFEPRENLKQLYGCDLTRRALAKL